MSSHTVSCVSFAGQTMIDCEDCGPLGVYQDNTVSTTVYDHLKEVHGCNMDSVEIRDYEEKAKDD